MNICGRRRRRRRRHRRRRNVGSLSLAFSTKVEGSTKTIQETCTLEGFKVNLIFNIAIKAGGLASHKTRFNRPFFFLKCPVPSQKNCHCYIIVRFCVCYILVLCFCVCYSLVLCFCVCYILVWCFCCVVVFLLYLMCLFLVCDPDLFFFSIDLLILNSGILLLPLFKVFFHLFTLEYVDGRKPLRLTFLHRVIVDQ